MMKQHNKNSLKFKPADLAFSAVYETFWQLEGQILCRHKCLQICYKCQHGSLIGNRSQKVLCFLTPQEKSLQISNKYFQQVFSTCCWTHDIFVPSSIYVQTSKRSIQNVFKGKCLALAHIDIFQMLLQLSEKCFRFRIYLITGYTRYTFSIMMFFIFPQTSW